MKLLPASFTGETPEGEKFERTGKLAVCDVCDSQEFIVFQLDGHDHLHLQCAVCRKSYCPKGGPCQV